MQNLFRFFAGLTVALLTAWALVLVSGFGAVDDVPAEAASPAQESPDGWEGYSGEDFDSLMVRFEVDDQGGQYSGAGDGAADGGAAEPPPISPSESRAIAPSTSAPKPTTTSTTPTSTPSTATTITPPTTTSPPVSVGSFDAVVRPGESIQAAVNGLPEGAAILIGSGVHVGQEVLPKSGMVFVGEAGAVLDGQNVTSFAFVAFSGGASDVTIRGLEVRNYVPSDPPLAAIQSGHVSGWVVEDCEVHHSRFAGIYVGPNSVVRNCRVHHNGRIGLKATGNNVLFESNVISFNNPDNASDPLWEAGGIKFGKANGTVIRKNHIHDNHGPGIWADVNVINTIIEGNRVENNHYAGIDYEISSYGVIRNNTVRNNGHKHPGGWLWGAGITIRSPYVEVYGNVVEGNRNGITLIQTDRGASNNLREVNVYKNVIINSGLNGADRSAGPAAIYDESSFEDNEYRYTNLSEKWWRWDDSSMNRDQWNSAGNDLNGTFHQG